MTKSERNKFLKRLQELADQIQARVDSAEEEAERPTGGEAAGDLSNAPVHLADVGSEEFAQEIGATLLENEQYLQGEISDALGRIKNSTFGSCEKCGREISIDRLNAIPYARHCITCARSVHAGREVNLNEGRPRNWTEGIGLRAEGPPPGAPGGDEITPTAADTHAAGSPGGGSAVGGLAGTTVGAGDPDEAPLEDAMGSGEFDVEIESNRARAGSSAEEESPEAYSGPAGGAVGGTPANKRSSGGKGGSKRPRPAG